MAVQRYSYIEITLGLFVAFCLALFIGMAITYGHISFLWQPHQQLVVVFADASGLHAEAPVRFNGMEVGRVNQLKVLRLDKETLPSLPVLTKHDLDNLPLHGEIKRNLRAVADADFDAACRAELENCTMIEVFADVLRTGDLTTYRQDDQVRIVSTVFGDSALELISGNGPCAKGPSHFLLGTSGDFFSNLAKSMGNAKDILASASTMIGANEQHSFTTATHRAGTITQHVQAISRLFEERAPETLKRVDTFKTATKNLQGNAGHVSDELMPALRAAQAELKSRSEALQNDLVAVREAASRASLDLKESLSSLRADWSHLADEVQPPLAKAREHMQALYAYVSEISSKATSFRSTGELVLGQNQSDLQRFLKAASNSILGLQQVNLVGNENKDLMISNKDVGEHGYNTLLSTYRHMDEAVLHFHVINAQLEEMTPMLAQWDATGASVKETDSLRAQINLTRRGIELGRDIAEEKLLPVFERKKSCQSYRGLQNE